MGLNRKFVRAYHKVSRNIILVLFHYVEGLIMTRKQLNSEDKKGFSVSESFRDGGKSFEQIMQEILSQVANSKDFPSNYNGSHIFNISE